MDIYLLSKTLDNEFTISDVIDEYESIMWTEQFRDIGDFELNMEWSPELQAKLPLGSFLSIPESRRVMMVVSRTTEIDDSGDRKLKVTGESLEHIFKLRHFQLVSDRRPYDATLSFRPGDYSYNGICSFMVRTQLTRNTSGNRINNLAVIRPNGYPEYDPVPLKAPLAIEQGNLHDILQSVSKQGGIGYRLITRFPSQARNPLSFDAYTPTDRTTPEDYVIFGEMFENVRNVRTFKSVEGYYNRIWINGHPAATATLWHSDGAADSDDFHRRLGYEGYDVQSILDQEENDLTAKEIARSRAEQFLAEVPPTFVVDGEVDHLLSTYEYEIDYHLGDLVHYVDIDNEKFTMRVSAQTFISDSDGFRTYPTLSEANPYGEVFASSEIDPWL